MLASIALSLNWGRLPWKQINSVNFKVVRCNVFFSHFRNTRYHEPQHSKFAEVLHKKRFKVSDYDYSWACILQMWVILLLSSLFWIMLSELAIYYCIKVFSTNKAVHFFIVWLHVYNRFFVAEVYSSTHIIIIEFTLKEFWLPLENAVHYCRYPTVLRQFLIAFYNSSTVQSNHFLSSIFHHVLSSRAIPVLEFLVLATIQIMDITRGRILSDSQYF